MGVLQIVIAGLDDLSGDVRGALYAEGSPSTRNPAHAVRHGVTRVSRGRATFVFRDLPSGRYALCLPDIEDCDRIDFDDRAMTYDGKDLVVRIAAARLG